MRKIIVLTLAAGTLALAIALVGAIAKVEIREAGEHIYTDYFGLYRMSDGWKIVNKIFQDHP